MLITLILLGRKHFIRLRKFFSTRQKFLSTVVDSSAKNAFEISKENYLKQKQKRQTLQKRLQTVHQMKTLHLKQNESDSNYSDTKSENSESSYNSMNVKKTLKGPGTSVPSDFTFNRKQFLQDGRRAPTKR